MEQVLRELAAANQQGFHGGQPAVQGGTPVEIMVLDLVLTQQVAPRRLPVVQGGRLVEHPDLMVMVVLVAAVAARADVVQLVAVAAVAIAAAVPALRVVLVRSQVVAAAARSMEAPVNQTAF